MGYQFCNALKWHSLCETPPSERMTGDWLVCGLEFGTGGLHPHLSIFEGGGAVVERPTVIDGEISALEFFFELALLRERLA